MTRGEKPGVKLQPKSAAPTHRGVVMVRLIPLTGPGIRPAGHPKRRTRGRLGQLVDQQIQVTHAAHQEPLRPLHRERGTLEPECGDPRRYQRIDRDAGSRSQLAAPEPCHPRDASHGLQNICGHDTRGRLLQQRRQVRLSPLV